MEFLYKYWCVIFILILIILKLKSKNSYFEGKPKKYLISKWQKLIILLLVDYGYKENEIDIIENAYFYFILNPKDYDGATLIQDRYFINGLCIASMLHDYNYIKAKSLNDYFVANIIYAKMLRKQNMFYFFAWGQCLFLHIISPFHYLFNLKRINNNK